MADAPSTTAPAPAPIPISSTPTTSDTKPPPPPPPPAGLPRIVHNDPSRTGFDPQIGWWTNYFRIKMGQVSPEGQFHYREWRYREHEARDRAQCEAWRDWCFAHSPTVVFLRNKIRDLGAELDASNVACRRCPARLTEDGEVHRQSGGFSPDHGILICANEIQDRKHLEDTLAHEMVHAWDTLRWKVDWLGDKDLKHAACTEVRFLFLIPPFFFSFFSYFLLVFSFLFSSSSFLPKTTCFSICFRERNRQTRWLTKEFPEINRSEPRC